MRPHGRRLRLGALLGVALLVGSLPSAASGATPDGKHGVEFYTWGGDDKSGISELTSLPPGVTVTDLVGGCRFVAALLSDGSVRVWGSQPPMGWTDSALGDTKAVAIAAGYWDLMVLTDSGELRDFGLGAALHALDTPPGLEGKTVVDFGVTRTPAALALTSDGHVVAWGRDHSSDPAAPDITHVPDVVAQNTVTDIDVGDDARAEALLSTGEVVEWGPSATAFPAAPPGDPYTQVSIGDRETLAVTASGKVVQQADEPWEPVPSSLDGKVVTKVDTESTVALALTADGHVVQWGDTLYPPPAPPSVLAGRTVTAVAMGITTPSAAVLGEFSGSTTVTGQATVGQTLTASSTVSPTPTSTTYQWLRDGQPIADSTSSTYALTMQDRGHRISAVATSSLPAYVDKSIASAPTATVRMPVKTFSVATGRYLVRRGQRFVVTASGLAPGETYTIRIGGHLLATGTASTGGGVWRRVTMPASMALTRHRLTVTGWQSDRTGSRLVRTVRR
jgi:hypothetical protein